MGKPKRKTKAAKPKLRKAQEAAPLSMEQKLVKILSREAERAPSGPLLFGPDVFAILHRICKQWLEQNQHSQIARDQIATLSFSLRREAMKRFGHDTIETLELARLLPRPIAQQAKGRMDAISHIMRLHNKQQRLSAEQQTAAEQIQNIWRAFGKGLAMRGRDLSRLGGSGQVLHPLDTMDEELFKGYREIFSPWIKIASRRVVGHCNGHAITMAAVVFSVLVEDNYPEVLDAQYGFDRDCCLKAVKRALGAYWEPAKLLPRAKIVAKGGDSPKAAIPEAGKSEMAVGGQI